MFEPVTVQNVSVPDLVAFEDMTSLNGGGLTLVLDEAVTFRSPWSSRREKKKFCKYIMIKECLWRLWYAAIGLS